MKAEELKSYLGKFGLLKANGKYYIKEIHGWITGIEGDKYVYLKDNDDIFRKFEINKIKSFKEMKFKDEGK